MESQNMQNLTIGMYYNLQKTTEFTVLRHFVRSKDKLVWLAIAGDSRCIIVVKQYETADSDAKIPEKEETCWKKINRCNNVRICNVRGLQALLMPLVFTASVGRDKRVSFDVDLSRWCCQTGGTPGELPPSLAAINTQIRAAFTVWTDARVVARQALQGVANARVVHRDIEWRHFALLPIFSGDVVIRLEPVMIDFADCDEVASTELAMYIMKPLLDGLIAATVWSV